MALCPHLSLEYVCSLGLTKGLYILVSLISFFVVVVLGHIGSSFMTLTYKTVSDWICIRHFRNERKKPVGRLLGPIFFFIFIFFVSSSDWDMRLARKSLATNFRSVLKWQMSDRFESGSSISYFAPMFWHF